MTFDPFADPFRFGTAPSTADIFKRYRGGGSQARGNAGRPRKPEAAPEPEAEVLPAEPAPAEEKQDKVVLRNPKWESEEVGFNEEAEVSVEATVPEAHAHKTRVAFELFAKMPAGPERISQAEGQTKDGKALAKVPVYIPQYRGEEGNLLAVVEYYFTAKHSMSDLLSDDTVVKKVDHLADRLINPISCRTSSSAMIAASCACPVCNRSGGAVGVIMNKDFSNLFFRSTVKALKRAPKVLVLANCCRTAITAAYAGAWIKKGVRW